MVTDAEKIAELKRELKVRNKFYPKRIQRGLLTQANADRYRQLLLNIIDGYMNQWKHVTFEQACEMKREVNREASFRYLHYPEFIRKGYIGATESSSWNHTWKAIQTDLDKVINDKKPKNIQASLFS